jgi:hypothetical protein
MQLQKPEMQSDAHASDEKSETLLFISSLRDTLNESPGEKAGLQLHQLSNSTSTVSY